MRTPSEERKRVIDYYDRMAEAREKDVPWRSIIETLDRETGEDNSPGIVRDVHRTITLNRRLGIGGEKKNG